MLAFSLVDGVMVRFLTYDDVNRITEYYQKNRIFLQEWEPIRGESFFEYEGWSRRLSQLSQLHKHHLAYYFVMVDTNKDVICGVLNLSNLIQYPFYACQLGYSIDEDYQGQGLMSLAVKSVVQWLFEYRGYHRVIAGYMTKNKRSERVLNKCGFEREGLAKSYLLINGCWEDHILMANINQDWIAPDASE